VASFAFREASVSLESAVHIPEALDVVHGCSPEPVAVEAEMVVIARVGDESDLVTAEYRLRPVGNPLDLQLASLGGERKSLKDGRVEEVELHLCNSRFYP
jgi:hypothetical protein